MIEASPDSCPRCAARPANGWVLGDDGIWERNGYPLFTKGAKWSCLSERNHHGVLLVSGECLENQLRQCQRTLERAALCMNQVAEGEFDEQAVIDLQGMAAEIEDQLAYQTGIAGAQA